MRRLMGTALSLALLLAACGGQGSSTGPSASNQPSTPALADNQTMRADLGTEPPSQDPTQATDSASIAVLRQTTATLVFYDEQLNVIPWLASSWDISPDGTVITFHLRDNIKYSNGDPIVAGDFVFSWQRLIDPRNAAGYSYIMADVDGRQRAAGRGRQDHLGCRHQRHARQVRRLGTRRQDLRGQAGASRRLLRLHRDPLRHRAAREEVGRDQGLHRSGQLGRLGPDDDDGVDAQLEDRPQAQSQLEPCHWRQAGCGRSDDCRDRLHHDHGSDRRPRGVRGR